MLRTHTQIYSAYTVERKFLYTALGSFMQTFSGSLISSIFIQSSSFLPHTGCVCEVTRVGEAQQIKESSALAVLSNSVKVLLHQALVLHLLAQPKHSYILNHLHCQTTANPTMLFTDGRENMMGKELDKIYIYKSIHMKKWNGIKDIGCCILET